MPEETITPGIDSSSTQNSGSDAGATVESTVPAATPVETTQAAEPSVTATEKVEKQPSLNEVISKSLKGEDSAATVAEGKQEVQPPKLNADGTKKDSVEEAKVKEEDARLDKHPRFQQVIKERNSLREQFKQVENEVKEYRSVTGYMQQHGLAPNEVNIGFQVMAAIKNDPMKAIELLGPYVQRLNEFAGITLPPQLQQQVNEGLITSDHAQLLARSQNQNGLLQNQMRERQIREQAAQQQNQQAQQRAAEEQRVQQLSQGVLHAVGGWEAQKKQTDPDYQKKEKFLLQAIRAEFLEKPPLTPTDAVKLAEAKWQEITTNLREFIPRRAAINPLQSTTSSSNGRPQAGSMREAVARSLERATA